MRKTTRLETQVKLFNAQMRDDLGCAPNGEQMFKWDRTDRVSFFENSGFGECQLPSGLWVMVTEYKDFTLADIYGKRWTIMKWREWPKEKWLREHGTSLPWPSKGEYEMVDGAIATPDGRCVPFLEVGEEPTELMTKVFIFRMKQHLEMAIADHKRQLNDAMARKAAAESQRLDDLISDALFPFEQIPGTKGSASLPTPKFQRIEIAHA